MQGQVVDSHSAQGARQLGMVGWWPLGPAQRQQVAGALDVSIGSGKSGLGGLLATSAGRSTIASGGAARIGSGEGTVSSSGRLSAISMNTGVAGK